MEKSSGKRKWLFCGILLTSYLASTNGQPYPPLQTTTQAPFPLPPDTQPDGTRKVTCAFDDDALCGWANAVTVQPGLTAFLPLAELNGITLVPQNGAKFLAADSNKGFIARIASINPGGTGSRILKFDFASSGRGARKLSVYIAQGNQVVSGNLVYSYEDFGSKRAWTSVTASFEAPATAYRIVIEAKFFLRNSAIAVDNIVLGEEDGQVVSPIEPPAPPTRPAQVAVIPGGTCNFDGGLCPAWTATTGLGEWTTGTATTDQTVAPKEGPKAGLSYFYTSGAWLFEHSAEIVTAEMTLTESDATKLNGRTRFWINIYTNTETAPAHQYDFKVLIVSADARQTVVRSEVQQALTSGWVQWETETYCLDTDSRLKFVLRKVKINENDVVPLEHFFAIDEVVTDRLADDAAGIVHTCAVVPVVPPTDPAPVLPPCVTWLPLADRSCNFDTDLCGWTAAIGSSLFVFKTTATTNPTPGIPIPIINAAKQGPGYALATCTPVGDITTLVLEDIAQPTDLPFIGRISFWYVHIGVARPASTLQLLLEHGAETRTIWKSVDGLTSGWRYASVEFKGTDGLTATDALKLRFELARANCDYPTALDDVVLEQGQATKSCVTCGFEKVGAPNDAWASSLCGWNGASDVPNRWKTVTGVVGSAPYQVEGARQGAGYLYVDSGSLTDFSQGAQLVTQLLPPVKTTVSFYYRAYGSGVSALNLYLDLDGTRYLLWSDIVNSDTRWKQASVGICPEKNHKLIIEAKFSRPGFGIALDDIQMLSEGDTNVPPATCEALVHVIDELSCGFDNGFCEGWSVQPGQFSFQAHNGRSTNGGIPPKHGTGYAFVDAFQAPREPRAFAELRSAPYHSPAGRQPKIQLDFYVFVGAGLVQVDIVQINPRRGSATQIVSYPSLHNTTEWMRMVVPPTCLTSKDVQLGIRVTPLTGFAVFGIDTVDAKRGGTNECNEDEVRPVTNILSCKFENDLCGWAGNNYQIVPSSFVAGGFGDNHAVASAAGTVTLTSHKAALTKPSQLTFNYNVFNEANFQSLKVIANQDSGPRVLWSLTGSTLVPFNTWLPARIRLCLTGTFTLTIQATFTPGSQGQFGIDNLVINEEATALTTGNSAFSCPVVAVAPISLTCSLDADSTATSFCGWAPKATVGVAVIVGTLPDSISQGDYEGQAGGRYLSILPVAGEAGTKSASVGLPAISTGSGDTGLTFWYQVRGGGVELIIDDEAQKTSVPLAGPTIGWTPFHRELRKSATVMLTLSVAFSATPPAGSGDTQYFALDNVWFASEPGYIPDDGTPANTTPAPGTTPTGFTGTTPAQTTKAPAATTQATGLSKADIIYISGGCCLAAVVIAFIIFVIIYNRNAKKRAMTKSRVVANQIELELMAKPLPVVAMNYDNAQAHVKTTNPV